MAVPNTPGEARRLGLRRARIVAASTALGAAVVVTGTIAVANAAPSNANDRSPGVANDSSRYSDGGDDFGGAQSFNSQNQFSPQQQQFAPQFQPQTRSRGS